MKTIKNVLLVAVLFISATVLAQTKLTGTVVDEMGEPLPGASVIEKGTSNGVATDFDGNFTVTSNAASGTLVVSFIGYTKKEVAFTLANPKLGTIQLEMSNTLDEIVVTATSFAVDRKTPVAVSTIKSSDIELKLGTQEFPEVLKSTPGVYATKEGGGFGDGRINLRGFDSQNVAVMINGVPVNDMESGRVFWSNWAGLGDVTDAMQVQRGLGASKVAVPSIGGTINIITKSTDIKKGGNIIMSTGNNGYQKYGFTLSTGLMDNGFAATTSVAKLSGDGYVNGTQFEGWNYFLNISKKINDNHEIALTTFGAPQEHGQRRTQSPIEHYRKSKDGIRYNPDWGYRNGRILNTRTNFYHKNQTSLNHYWTINDQTTLSTALYLSIGNGGGTRAFGPERSKLNRPDSNGFSEYRDGNFGPINFDKVAEENRVGEEGSKTILAKDQNNHNWYGVLSTFKTALTDKIDFVGGVDLRQYTGFHFRKVDDLLGGKYFVDNANVNDSNQIKKVGDGIAFNNDGVVGWQGLFMQLEYSNDDLDIFLSSALSNTSYQRIDYFNYLDTDPIQTSPKFNFMGHSIKGGLNYRVNSIHNVFANVGYFERAPTFRAVFPNFNNVDILPNAENEKIFSVELGYGLRSEKFAANVNIYRTQWNDRTFNQRVNLQGGDVLFANLQGVDALHQGVEGDFTWRPTDKLNVTGMFSVGNWLWDSNLVDSPVFNDSQELVGTVDMAIKGTKVADAAQTTAALGLLYKFWEKGSFTLDYNYFGNLYSDFNLIGSFTKKDEAKTPTKPIGNTWKIPDYHTFDGSFRYGFELNKTFDTTLTLRVNNILNVKYIADARDGNGTAAGAEVWYGTGRTFSLGAKIKF